MGEDEDVEMTECPKCHSDNVSKLVYRVADSNILGGIPIIGAIFGNRHNHHYWYNHCQKCGWRSEPFEE